MSHKKSPSILNLALLIALSASPIAAIYWSLESVIAQSPSASPTTLPTAVPGGAAVRIDGSNSMAVVNQSLKQRYKKESPGTNIDLGSNGSDAALQALLDGKVDIAAIGRPLTAAEKQKGLVPVSIGREKIAIITSSENPYRGNVTFQQFAKVFRGEITNWSQLGGTPGEIRFIDRPETSDTRQAFKSYPVFKAAPFKAGATATAVSQDITADVIQKLGKDGMGYAAYSQVKGVDGVKIISMHKTLPDNPAYPFSKPRYFVTKGTPSAPAKDFLAYATGASGLAAIAAANQAEAAAIAPAVSPSAPVSPTVAPETATSPDATTSPSIVTSPSPESVAIAPVPDATNQGLAGLIPWLLLVPAAILGWIWWSARGRRTPATPLPSSSAERSPVPSVGEVPAAATAQTSLPSVAPVPPVAQSPVVPPVPPIVDAPLAQPIVEGASGVSGINSAIVGGAAIAGGAGLAALASNGKAAPAPSTLIEPSLDLPKPEAVSSTVLVSPESSAAFPISVGQPDLNLGLAAGAALAAGAGVAWAKRSQDADVGQGAAIAALPVSDSRSLADVDDGLAQLPSGYGDSRIVLMPRDPQWAYAYWDASESHKAALRHQGGERLALRFYDVTDAELSQQNPHSLQQYDCEEIATDWYIPVPLSDRDYIVEIGYLANDGRWLMLARSAPIRIPPIYPSDLIEEQDVTIAWDEELNGKTFATPLTYEKKARTIHQTMYELAHATAGDRVESSLHSSIQAARSDVFPSGVGMMSGVGMSGVGMGLTASGVGMSGVGMSGVGIGALTTSGVGMSGVGIGGLTASGIGMSGVGMSGVGMSGVGIGALTTSGVGMSGVGMSGVGIGALTASGIGMSGIGMSGIGMSGVGMSGVGMSGVGIGALTTSGVGMSGVGIGGLTTSGVGMSGVGMSGIGMSGIGMSGIGMMSGVGIGGLTTSGVGMSGVGMSGIGMSGIGMSGIGFFASMPPIRSRKFWLVADAELIIYGATEPDATLTIAGRPVQLNPDGTFRFQMSFQDGMLDFPILAVAVDGVQTRAIHLTFDRTTPVRQTNEKDDAVDEWLPS